MRMSRSLAIPVCLVSCALTFVGCPPAEYPEFTDSWPVYVTRPDSTEPTQVTPQAIAATEDGGVLISGNCKGLTDQPILVPQHVDPEHSGMFALRANGQGQVQWWRTISVEGTYPEFIESDIEEMPDGGVTVAGGVWVSPDKMPPLSMPPPDYEHPAVLIVKMDADGNELLTRTVNLEIEGWTVRDIEITSDGGVILVASGDGQVGLADICVFKLDAEGDQEWQTTFDDESPWRSPSCIAQAEGGYVIGASVQDPDTYQHEGLLLKLDPEGNREWTRSYEIGNTLSDVLFGAIEPTPDAGLVLAGRAWQKACLTKTDLDGNMEWSRRFEHDCYRMTARVTSDGDYICALERGYPTYSTHVMRVDGNGNAEWERTLGRPSDWFEFGAMDLLSDGTCMVAGTLLVPWHGEDPMFLTRLDENGEVAP